MLHRLFFLPIMITLGSDWETNYLGDIHNHFCLTPDQTQGLCISIYDCLAMVNFLEQFSDPLPQEIEIFLAQYSCNFGDAPKICCPPEAINFSYKNLTMGILPDVTTHKNLKLLPPACGRNVLASKITHGKKTSIFEFPWMALIAYTTRKGPEFQCGGSIINTRYILTAAHCVSRLKFPLQYVRVGDHNTKTIKDCQFTEKGRVCAPPFQDLEIEAVMPHEKYNYETQENDIGLLRVSQINYTPENTAPICLPTGEARTFNFTDREGIIAGWGITEAGVPSPELLKISLPFVSLIICQVKYGAFPKLDIRQLCAGGMDQRDACGGDSGGPVVVNSTINGNEMFVQQGIVSFGPIQCGKQPLPGVYTRVAMFMDWILDHLKP